MRQEGQRRRRRSHGILGAEACFCFAVEKEGGRCTELNWLGRERARGTAGENQERGETGQEWSERGGERTRRALPFFFLRILFTDRSFPAPFLPSLDRLFPPLPILNGRSRHGIQGLRRRALRTRPRRLREGFFFFFVFARRRRRPRCCFRPGSCLALVAPVLCRRSCRGTPLGLGRGCQQRGTLHRPAR